MSNLDAFSTMLEEVLRSRFGLAGEPRRVPKRYRTVPHGKRRAQRRKMNAAAREARKLNRPTRRGRTVPPQPRR